MRSGFASLRFIVLPFGATSGRRIVINGATGRIEVYDAAGVLRGVLQPESTVFGVYDDLGQQLVEINDSPGITTGIVALELPATSSAPMTLSSKREGDSGVRFGVTGNGTVYLGDGDVAGDVLALTLATAPVRLNVAGGGLSVEDDITWDGAGYDTYTPTWEVASGTNPTIGNATRFGRYKVYGRMVHYYGYIVRGSTTVNGSGNYRIGLPVEAATNERSGRIPKGPGWFRDDSAGDYNGFTVINTDGLYFNIRGLAGTSSQALWSNSSPVTLATDDYVGWNFVYERAA